MPASHTGVPFINVGGGFAIGNGWEGELPQVGNSFMWTDSLTWVKSNHTMKFGADVRRSRFDQTLYYNVSGQLSFNSTTENSVLFDDNYPGYSAGTGRQLYSGLGPARKCAQHWSLSVCAGQLENQAIAYFELRAALGTGYAPG